MRRGELRAGIAPQCCASPRRPLRLHSTFPLRALLHVGWQSLVECTIVQPGHPAGKALQGKAIQQQQCSLLWVSERPTDQED